MSRIRAALVATVLLTMLVPAVSPAAGPRATDRLDLPQPWRAHERTAFAQLTDARGSLVSEERFEEIRRGLLRMEAGNTAAIADPDFVFPARAGDLDADGKNDVLTFEFTGNTQTLRARRGTNGAELWNVPGAYVAIPGDIDGDSDGDVVTFGSKRTRVSPNIDDVEEPGSVDTVEQSVSLVRGDGTVVWTYDVPSIGVRAGDLYRGAGSDLEAVVSLRVIPDATGDGKKDVWVGTTTFLQINVEVLITAEHFTGRVIDGVTGVQFGALSNATVDSVPWIVPAADVNGDDLADAFSLTGDNNGSGILAARALAGAPIWAQQIDAEFGYPFVHELTGDGRPDIVVQAFTGNGPQRLAFNGSTGAPLWSQIDNGYIDAAGDIDGDGATDMIQVAPADPVMNVRAWSGKTGQDLWGPVSYTGPEGAWIVYCFCTDDLTADGVWDPLIGEIVFGDEVTLKVRALDGTTGAALWTEFAPTNGTFPVPVGADADGDGATDLGIGSSDGASATVALRRGRDFVPAWSTTTPLDGFPIGFYGENLIGDAEPEIVLASLRFVEEWSFGSARALTRTGLLWSVY